MPRNMSFAHTTEQIRTRTKDVTRRNGWADLKPGELFWAVEKVRGLKKGQKVKRLALLRCIRNTPSVLYNITPQDVRREGFPSTKPIEFVRMFIRKMGGAPDQALQRIEFEYIDDPAVIAEAKKVKRRKGRKPRG